MKLVPFIILMAAGVLAASPAFAENCEEIEAQDLNSRIEAGLLLAETSESLDADGQNRIEALREDFSQASDSQAQALDSGDSAKLNEVCQTYEDILKQVETLSQ